MRRRATILLCGLAMLELTLVSPLVAGRCLAKALEQPAQRMAGCCGRPARSAKSGSCCSSGQSKPCKSDRSHGPVERCPNCLPGCPACCIVSAVPVAAASWPVHLSPSREIPLVELAVPLGDLQEDIFHPPRG